VNAVALLAATLTSLSLALLIALRAGLLLRPARTK